GVEGIHLLNVLEENNHVVVLDCLQLNDAPASIYAIPAEKLIPIVSTDLAISDEEIIEIYKRRWNIEQGYKELREHFGFGKE
ncbi:MAG: hypothetical protein DRQ78_11670, partial [Epsilonproteobacteria bacterium]